MSLTLTLQDDVAALLEAEASQQRQPVPVLASNLLRRALAAKPAAPPPSQEPFRIQPHPGKIAADIPPVKLNRLADELDTEARLKRQAP